MIKVFFAKQRQTDGATFYLPKHSGETWLDKQEQGVQHHLCKTLVMQHAFSEMYFQCEALLV